MQVKIRKDNIVETDDLSIEKLQELKDQLQVEIGKMQGDIFEAKAKHQATGEYADPEWFKRIHFALKVSNLNKEKLNRAIADRKRIERQEKSLNENKRFERLFMQITFEMLGAAQYQLILSETQRRVGETQETQVLA